MKLCTTCNTLKGEEEFYIDSKTKRPVCPCKTCHKARSKKWGQENNDRRVEIVRNSQLKKRYGISLPEYLELYEQQAGLCKICEAHEEWLHLDHCHTTNRVRGLLCGPCNRGLGIFKDSRENLLRAAKYLEE